MSHVILELVHDVILYVIVQYDVEDREPGDFRKPHCYLLHSNKGRGHASQPAGTVTRRIVRARELGVLLSWSFSLTLNLLLYFTKSPSFEC